jgi:hypothetical protein
MLRRALIYLLILITSVSIIYFLIIHLQSYFITKTIENNFVNSGVDEEDYSDFRTIRCNLDLFNPKIAFVNDLFYKNLPQYNIFMFRMERPFSSKPKEVRIGGTTVKNVTFPELVAMVKEDCDQFQDGHVSDVEGEPEWVYTRAKTKEEKVADIKEGFLANENRYSSFREIYGDVEQMTDEEVLALHEKIKEEGLDERVDTEMKADWIRDKVYDLSEDQWEKVKARYGDLLELSDEELIEKDKEITADWESGEFVLIEE